MNRKWLAALTLCIAAAGWTLLHAQSSSPSQAPQPQVLAEASAEPVWVGDEPFDPFTAPVDAVALPAMPFPDPADGDVFFYSSDGAADMALAGPPEVALFSAAVPFPPPDPVRCPVPRHRIDASTRRDRRRYRNCPEFPGKLVG